MISLRNVLTQRNLYDKVDSYAIFKAYCKNFREVGKNFSSEFREDSNPSCRIENVGGDLLYTDFGEGSYYAISYVMRKFSLSRHDAMRKISFDFNLDMIDFSQSNSYFPKTEITDLRRKKYEGRNEKTPTGIKVKYCGFTADELRYWDRHGWTFDMLYRASIKSISNFWITMEHIGMIDVPFSVKDEMAFVYDYYMHDGVFRRKLYFPERSDRRFISNVDNTIIQNWDLLPKQGGDILWITSSKKDTGCFWHLNGHFCNAIAPNNELSFIPEEVFYNKIRPRWKRIILWFDNDYEKDQNFGIINAKKFSQMYNIEYFYNPIQYKAKDPAELVAKYGLREFNQLLKHKLESDGN